MDVDLDTVLRVLGSLGIQAELQGPDSVEAAIPYWRNDITIEEDLVEEVVRIVGYDSVPVTMFIYSDSLPSIGPQKNPGGTGEGHFGGQRDAGSHLLSSNQHG